ncbi:MAG: helix-turn-helix transcriptional regulator [Bacilli bacterium]|nr:helix-turn-helix transcriptional regulator [Bacilli bacterium]
MKLVDIKLLKGVIEELGIEDKIIINDDYIKFLLDDPCKNIIKIRERMNLTRQEFADMLEVSITSVRRWENGNSHISRNKYNKLKKCMS